MNVRTRIALLAPAAALALLSACSVIPEVTPDLTRYYVLTTAPAAEPAPAADVQAVPRISLRPVVVPEFLRGRIMQVRSGPNEVRFIDNARWAEPLESGLNRVLRENLGQRASAVRIVSRTGEPHDFDVAVHIRQFEGVLPAGAAGVSARIEVYSTDVEPKLLAQENFNTLVTHWDGKDHGQLAQKLSEAAAKLSERIIATLAAAKG
jgi:uncharacterized lipoprotein YmbA